MRHTTFAAVLLLGACGDSTQPSQVSADNAAAEIQSSETARQENVSNELIEQPNGATLLRLEGNDSATFVGGDLVEVNRAP